MHETKQISDTRPVTGRERTAGGRFSPTDAAVIGLCVLVVWLLWVLFHEELPWVVWIPPVVLAHFFLFCNLFRLRRRYEVVWSALFLVNLCGWLLLSPEPLRWSGVLVVQTPITLVAILAEMHSPAYHGIFSRRLNPSLEDYLRTSREAPPKLDG